MFNARMGRRALLGLVAAAALSTVAVASAADRTAAADPILLFDMATVGTTGTNQVEIPAGVKAAVMAINAAGGIKGRQLSIEDCNDNNDPNQKVACVRQAGSDHVVASVGSTLFQNADPLIESTGIPVIGTCAIPSDFQYKNRYPIDGCSVLGPIGLPFALRNAGYKKMVFLHGNNPSQVSLTPFLRAAARVAKIGWGGDVTFPSTPIPDYTPYAQKLKDVVASSGADSVAIQQTFNLTVPMIRAAQALGVKVVFAHNNASLGNPEVQSLGSAGEGMVMDGTLPPSSATNLPGIARFRKEMTAAGYNPDDTEGRLFGVNAWLSVYGFAAVAKTIKGDINATSVNNALKNWPKNKPIDLFGIVKWIPSARGPAVFPALSNGTIYFEKAENGKVVLTDPKPFDIYKAMGYKVK
jgi:ABC-type branched-subunit amino acid transport system substrate-binding protein